MDQIVGILEELLDILNKFPVARLIGKEFDCEEARGLCVKLQELDPVKFGELAVNGSDEELMHSVSVFFSKL